MYAENYKIGKQFINKFTNQIWEVIKFDEILMFAKQGYRDLSCSLNDDYFEEL